MHLSLAHTNRLESLLRNFIIWNCDVIYANIMTVWEQCCAALTMTLHKHIVSPIVFNCFALLTLPEDTTATEQCDPWSNWHVIVHVILVSRKVLELTRQLVTLRTIWIWAAKTKYNKYILGRSRIFPRVLTAVWSDPKYMHSYLSPNDSLRKGKEHECQHQKFQF